MGAFTDNLVAKLARVVVPPHMAVRGGKKVKIEGYTYNRQGSKLNSLKSNISSTATLRDKVQTLNRKLPLPDGVLAFRGQERLRPAVQREILDAMDQEHKKWGVPLFLNAGKEGNVADEHEAWAVTQTVTFGDNVLKSQIHLNVDLLNSDKDIATLNTFESRQHLAPQNRSDIIKHEYGHVLAHRMQFFEPLKNAELEIPFISAMEGGLSDSYLIDLNTGEIGELNVASKLGLSYFVSGYAAEGVDEGIAESFLLYEKGTKNFWTEHVRLILEKEYNDPDSAVYAK